MVIIADKREIEVAQRRVLLGPCCLSAGRIDLTLLWGPRYPGVLKLLESP